MRPKRKPALERRYLITFATLLAGALAVSAPMVLLQTTEEQDTSWLDAEPQVAPYAVAGKGWDAVVTPEPAVTAESAMRGAIAELPPAVPLSPAIPTYTESLPEVQPDITTLSTRLAESESTVPSENEAKKPVPQSVQVAALDEEIIDEGSGASVTYSTEPEPQPIAPESLSDPLRTAELDDTHQAPEPQPEEFDVSEEKPAADVAPPLPPRRPAPPIKVAEIVVAQAAEDKPAPGPKQAARAERRDESRNDESRSDEPTTPRWRPMTLAPADADASASKPKLAAPAPRNTESSAAHRANVWSALARAKPRAGQRGSATVTFSIGATGALRGARVVKSSGNAKIDQLALATVRKAAPFPPPGFKSGAASYTIRIDF